LKGLGLFQNHEITSNLHFLSLFSGLVQQKAFQPKDFPPGAMDISVDADSPEFTGVGGGNDTRALV
jgi:hypothetical protein